MTDPFFREIVTDHLCTLYSLWIQTIRRSDKNSLEIAKSSRNLVGPVPSDGTKTRTESAASYSHDHVDPDVPLALITKTNSRLLSEPIHRRSRRSRGWHWDKKDATANATRRIKANARERVRVHTISDAFNRLRKIVPSCPTNPRPSKLSVLRIAKGYIVALTSCLLQNQVSPLDPVVLLNSTMDVSIYRM
ncbi:DNA-binding transcription factor NET [Fasciolopsis buskii]|uniref:DNA-binding transcription factor NET n=1 Tax=Fasciolopsis buskii TaxID=27845 RepID=A0A8E0VI65_9TREM|nr:DNA-binding transcription factor NET [Fasciolopsis buski]